MSVYYLVINRKCATLMGSHLSHNWSNLAKHLIINFLLCPLVAPPSHTVQYISSVYSLTCPEHCNHVTSLLSFKDGRPKFSSLSFYIKSVRLGTILVVTRCILLILLICFIWGPYHCCVFQPWMDQCHFQFLHHLFLHVVKGHSYICQQLICLANNPVDVLFR